MLCVTTLLLGIDVGWQPLPGGGTEYIIQIAPQAMGATIEAMRSDGLQSDIPAEVKDIRAWRILVGTGDLPRRLPPVPKVDLHDPPLPAPTSPAIRPELPDAKTLAPAETRPAPEPQEVPRRLPSDSAGKPIAAERATFVEQAGAAKSPQTKPSEASPSQPPPADRPWVALTLVTLGLFASLGGNVYLGWIAWDVYHRYRALLKA
jgi:hypothetical protein